MLKSDETRTAEQLEHLAQVRALTQAIASAISAIEKNNLRQFQDHLAIQETICNRLGAIKPALPSSTTTSKESVAENPDSQLQREIIDAHLALAQLNRVYAALLRRTTKSVALVAALYRSYGAGYVRGPAPLPPHRSWSCEV